MLVGIRAKLLGGFGAVLLLLAAVGGIAWRQTMNSAAAFADLYAGEVTELVELNDVARAVYDVRLGAMASPYISADARQRAATLIVDNQKIALIDADMKRLVDRGPSTEAQQLLRTWNQAYPAFLAARNQVVALSDQGRADESVALRDGQATTALAQVNSVLQDLSASQSDTANSKRTAVAAADDNAAHGILIVSVAALSITIGLGAYLLRNMRRLTGAIHQGASSLASASSEIHRAVAQQSSGSTEQSAAIAQTTATVEQVKASAGQAVQMAMVVSSNAQEASRVAVEGVQAADAATVGMTDLRDKVQSIAQNILALAEQSQKIGEIITTVSDLADQSNLLALNAAIEASRAGEQGKGFGVVATEIRTLAEQSKAATAQVRTILGDIQRATNTAVLSTEQGTRGVDTGIGLVEQTGRTIGELAEVIDQAAQSAKLIAASVRQHSVGMEQVAAAMVDINQATAHNLSATAETRLAAEHLTSLAGGLTQAVAQYND